MDPVPHSLEFLRYYNDPLGHILDLHVFQAFQQWLQAIYDLLEQLVDSCLDFKLISLFWSFFFQGFGLGPKHLVEDFES